MSDPELAELRRRAYGPPVSETDATAAQAELARLAADEHPVEWDVPRAPVFAVGGRGIRVVLAAAAVLTGAAALSLPAPADSLAVFDRTQNEQDLAVDEWAMHSSADSAFGADASSIRLLGNDVDAQAFAYRTPDGKVCLTVVRSGGAAGSCATLADFTARGLSVSYRGSFDGGATTTAAWGPSGGVRFSAEAGAP